MFKLKDQNIKVIHSTIIKNIDYEDNKVWIRQQDQWIINKKFIDYRDFNYLSNYNLKEEKQRFKKEVLEIINEINDYGLEYANYGTGRKKRIIAALKERK